MVSKVQGSGDEGTGGVCEILFMCACLLRRVCECLWALCALDEDGVASAELAVISLATAPSHAVFGVFDGAMSALIMASASSATAFWLLLRPLSTPSYPMTTNLQLVLFLLATCCIGNHYVPHVVSLSISAARLYDSQVRVTNLLPSVVAIDRVSMSKPSHGPCHSSPPQCVQNI